MCFLPRAIRQQNSPHVSKRTLLTLFCRSSDDSDCGSLPPTDQTFFIVLGFLLPWFLFLILTLCFVFVCFGHSLSTSCLSFLDISCLSSLFYSHVPLICIQSIFIPSICLFMCFHYMDYLTTIFLSSIFFFCLFPILLSTCFSQSLYVILSALFFRTG